MILLLFSELQGILIPHSTHIPTHAPTYTSTHTPNSRKKLNKTVQIFGSIWICQVTLKRNGLYSFLPIGTKYEDPFKIGE